MFRTIRNKIIKIKRISGVEIFLLEDGKMSINGVKLRIDKNEIIKEYEFESLDSLKKLGEKIDKKTPIALSINGKGIFHKKISLEQYSSNELEHILPGVNWNNFYIDKVKFESFASVTIAKKEVLDKITESLKVEGFRILSITIGMGNIQNIIPYLSLTDELFVKASNFCLYFNEQKVVIDVKPLPYDATGHSNKSEYNVGNQYVYSSAIIPFGSAMKLFTTDLNEISSISNEFILNEKNDFKYFIFYKASLWALLIGILSILAINFIFYDYYFKKNKEIHTYHSLTNDQINKIQRTKEKLLAKEEFIRRSGWTYSSKLSMYADRIAGLVPFSIMLTTMNIYPVHSNSFFENNQAVFQKDTIELTGTCEDPTQLNQFTNNLKNIQDFKNIAITNYSYKKEIENGVFNLEILIK